MLLPSLPKEGMEERSNTDSEILLSGRKKTGAEAKQSRYRLGQEGRPARCRGIPPFLLRLRYAQNLFRFSVQLAKICPSGDETSVSVVKRAGRPHLADTFSAVSISVQEGACQIRTSVVKSYGRLERPHPRLTSVPSPSMKESERQALRCAFQLPTCWCAAISHSVIVPSHPPAANREPSSEKHKPAKPIICPRRGGPNSRPLATSQSLIWPPKAAVASTPPSAESAKLQSGPFRVGWISRIRRSGIR
jgi:hypothetical protein